MVSFVAELAKSFGSFVTESLRDFRYQSSPKVYATSATIHHRKSTRLPLLLESCDSERFITWERDMNWQLSVCYGCATGYLLLVFTKLWLARRIVLCKLNQQSAHRTTYDGRLFTIVQPILSGDPLLEEMLSTNVRNLPTTQFLWMIDWDDLAGQEIAERILGNSEQADQQRIRMVPCPTAADNVNPKSFKLQLALQHVSTPFFVVLDDDTVVNESSLAVAQNSLQTHDLVTGLPTYRRGQNLTSDLVAHFVNDNSVLTYLPLLNFYPPLSINGMYYVSRTTTLVELHGFEVVQHLLCDDYAVAQWFRSRGKSIDQAIIRLQLATSVARVGDYCRLLHRWMSFACLLARDQRPMVQFLLGLLLGLPPILLAVAIATSFSSVYSAMVLVLVLLARRAAIGAAQRLAFAERLSTNPLVSLIAELLQPLHLFGAVVVPYIRWRGKLVRVARDHSFQLVRKRPDRRPS